MALFNYNTSQLGHCALKKPRPQTCKFLEKIFTSIGDLSVPQLLAFISQGCWKKTPKPWSPVTTKAPCKSFPLCTDGMKCYAFFSHSFNEILCLTSLGGTRLTWTIEFKKEMSQKEESDTRTGYNPTEKLGGITLSTLVRATHYRILSQHWAADSMGNGKWAALEGERKG